MTTEQPEEQANVAIEPTNVVQPPDGESSAPQPLLDASDVDHPGEDESEAASDAEPDENRDTKPEKRRAPKPVRRRSRRVRRR